MNQRHAPAISTLVRWRAFQEAVAERVCQQAAGRVLESATALQSARTDADVIVRRRSEMLDAGMIDLGLLQIVAEFERKAWDVVDARRETLRMHERERDDALAEHLAARTRTQVAETRRDRVVAEARDQEEKRLFDRMASLLVASTAATPIGESA
jgi:hypothetical protein